jgi:hypothetical protein
VSPFLFLGRSQNIDLLARHLRRVGVHHFEIFESETAYVPARVVLVCPWISSFEIVFRRSWWPDGTHQEDAEIVLAVEGVEIKVLDVRQLLGEKLAQSLPELIAEKLADVVEW